MNDKTISEAVKALATLNIQTLESHVGLVTFLAGRMTELSPSERAELLSGAERDRKKIEQMKVFLKS